MKMILIDGADVTTMDQVHDYFAEKLEFPEWYGRNLDALYDCLTDVTEELFICVDHPAQILDKLGTAGTALLTLLERCDEEQDNITCLFGSDT